MAELDVTVRPLPQRRPESAPFWDGLLEDEIRLQRCTSCGQVQYYPRPGCRHCGATTLAWEALSGDAELYSYTIIHRAPFEAFKPDVPYAFAVVQLAEGPRLISTIVTADFDALEVGMALRPVYDRVTDDIVLLRFEPA